MGIIHESTNKLADHQITWFFTRRMTYASYYVGLAHQLVSIQPAVVSIAQVPRNHGGCAFVKPTD